jgi:hypothetical protein
MMIKVRNLAFICCLLFPSVSWGEILKSINSESERQEIYEIVTKGEIITEFSDKKGNRKRIYLVIDYRKDLWTCSFSDYAWDFYSPIISVQCISMKNED